MEFRRTVLLNGKTATGIEVPGNIVDELGSGRRPRVTVTIGSHSYRTTVASMGGRFMIPLSADNRAQAGVAAGDEVEVGIELDTAPRVVEVPADLRAALADDAAARARFDSLAYSHKQRWVLSIEDAKKPETRARRIESAVAALRAESKAGS